jgi:hypothetical protein
VIKTGAAEPAAEADRGRPFGFAGFNVFPGGPGSLAWAFGHTRNKWENPQMSRLLVLPFAVISIWLNGCAPPSSPDKQIKAAVVLTLKTVNETIPAGTQPAFRLTIEYVGMASEKVLKPRGDLQDTYYDLEVTKDGKSLDLARSISDPGPVDAEDFLTLEPGKSVTFEFSRFAVAVHDLAPGKYQARIRFWQDPLQSHKTAVFSPAADFTVQK